MEKTQVQIIVALTVWENRVSPVFDGAQMLLVAEFVNGKVQQHHYHRFDPMYMTQFIKILKDMKVSLLVCGAISEEPAELIEAAGIELIPFITGSVHEVLGMVVADKPAWNTMKMPGCNASFCCKGRKNTSQLFQASELGDSMAFPTNTKQIVTNE